MLILHKKHPVVAAVYTSDKSITSQEKRLESINVFIFYILKQLLEFRYNFQNLMHFNIIYNVKMHNFNIIHNLVDLESYT